MYFDLEFCHLRFVSPKVCVVSVKAEQHIAQSHADRLLEFIRQRGQQELFIVVDRSASYTYDPGALNLLLSSGLFKCVCVVASNVAQRRLALYESMLAEQALKIFPSVATALLYCHELIDASTSPLSGN